jgi:hypothetical protein
MSIESAFSFKRIYRKPEEGFLNNLTHWWIKNIQTICTLKLHAHTKTAMGKIKVNN